MSILDEILNLFIPGRAARQIDRDPRYIRQQCYGTTQTPSTHLLRRGYIQRSDEHEAKSKRAQWAEGTNQK